MGPRAGLDTVSKKNSQPPPGFEPRSSDPKIAMAFYIHSLHGILFLGVKRPGREADHSPPSSAKVNALSTPSCVFVVCA
jgi:hypothetical protein